jgi:hypothetical protein
MAQTNGRITAAALIEHLLSSHIWRSRMKPELNGEAVLPGAFLSLLESSTDGKSILNNTRHPVSPSETITLHILHIPSVPSASNSFCILQGATIPWRASIFFSGRRGSLRLL